MRSTKLNRALSFLLVLVMILTLMPTAALAAPVGETKSSGSYDSIDAKYSVYEKVDKPAAGDTVVIYNAGNSMAVTSEILSTYYLKPLSISLNAELGVLASDSKLIAWTVSVDENGLYTFKQGDTALKMGTNQDSNGNTKFNLSGAGTATDKWHLDTCNAANGSYYMYGDGMKGKYGNVYIEYFLFKNKTTGAETPEFTTYCTSTDRLNEKAFGMTFYKLVREGVSDAPEDNGLPQVGDEVVIYNQSAKGVLALQNDSYCAKNAPTTIKDGEAVPSNGAVVFKVQKNGEYYRFYNETYGYLCSNGTGKNAFYTKEFTGSINDVEIKAEDADWLVRTCSGGVGGYEMESRSAKFSGHSQWLEYFSDCYQTYSMYSKTGDLDYTIYSFYFYPVAKDVKLTDGVVIKPVIEFPESVPAAYLGDDYEITVPFCSILGIDNPWTEYSIRDAKGNLIGDIMGSTDVEVLGDYTTGDGTVHFTIWDNDIEAAAKVGNTFTFTAAFKDTAGNEARASITVEIKDEPIIKDLTPAQGFQTKDDKTPTISANIINMGDGATVSMTLNDEPVDAQYSVKQVYGKDVGTVSYTPAEAMADGKVNVAVTVTRADGVSATKTWSFTVGVAEYQLYFGQLHSHTQYSDGAGSLDDALSYVANLPESANVQFVAFTDHSNYFDTQSSPNPEAALYDTNLVKDSDAKHSWSTYKSTVAKFNEGHSGSIVALAGFEMTWSGGPGHINTFNTPGVVSRNNSTLNNKTSDAGMKAYYALLSQSEGVDSISQFNHPGTTFGNFSDFSYWDAVIDSRMYLVEAGNGEGQIGAGGYYPSYEQYILALDKGWHLAPSNNQDNHKGKWGNANDARDVILTDNFSEAGIYQAIRDMRVYSTEDKNLEVNYTVNDLPLGSQITEIPEKLNINVSVYDPDSTDSISKVEVVVNSGKVAHTWADPADLASGNFSVELKPEYSYYFIRVTQADGDLAVTAPVWVGESLKLGISSFECGTSTPVTGEELELTTTVFNSEASDAKITSVVYTTDGSNVIGSDIYDGKDAIVVEKGSTNSVTFKYTPTVAKVTKITVTVNLEQDGKDYSFSKDIELDVLDSENLVYLGIDAAHYNEYVAGNYKDSMGNFSNLAAGNGVRTVMLKTSEDLIAACSNSKFKALILTAPSRRLAAAQTDPKVYSADELAAIAAFNKAGGTVIIAGWSDNYENYDVIQNNSSIMHMAATQNTVLEALGSSLRIADDATYDDVRSAADGVDKWRLYFNTYGENFLTDGVAYDADHPYDRMYTEVFSHYGGASVYAVGTDGKATTSLPSTVSPIVYGHATTYSVDVDKDGLGGANSTKYAYKEGDNRLMAMASEQLPGQGLIIVSGAAFMSNFEVQATVEDNGSEKNYSNYRICENLVNYINPTKITDIATVQAEQEEGVRYTIEGIVTSNASGYDKDTAFFDCIYVQDETAGINAFPVAGNYKVGDKVRITGTTSSYKGERQIAVKSIEKIGEATPVTPKNITAKQLNDGSVTGSLVTVYGQVTRFEYNEGLVETILVKDASGEVSRIFIDGYITTATDIAGLKVGCYVTATGLASRDDSFALDGEKIIPRIRIRDRADIVCSDTGSKIQIDLTTKSGTFKYDGTEHSVSGLVSDTVTVNGVKYTVSGLTASAAATNAGSYGVSVTGTAKVVDASGKDVTANCFIIVNAGSLVIEKRELTLTSASASKYYDGTALTSNEVTVSGDGFAKGEGASYTVTGTQTDVGESKNSFTYKLNDGTLADNYKITVAEGTLKVENSALPFKDVSGSQWFYKNVVYAYNHGLMNGMTADTFAPDATMTREMFATVIYRMADTPSVEGMTMPFTDVPTTSYAYNAILWAYNNGVVKGTSDTTFAPGDSITRAQTVTMLYRYAKSPAVTGTLSFTDAASIASWAYDAVLWASQNKIVNGYPTGGFGPDDTTTRGQMAKILQGFCELQK